MNGLNEPFNDTTATDKTSQEVENIINESRLYELQMAVERITDEK